MQVLALVTEAFGGHGGIAQYNRDFLEALARLEDVAKIEILPRLTKESAEGIPSGALQHNATFGKLPYSLKAAFSCLRSRPDVIFCGHLYHGPLAMRLARLCGAKLISQLHGTEIWDGIGERHLAPLEASDLVLCVSEDTRLRYLEQSRAGNDNAAVLHNTVGGEFRPGNRKRAREKFGLSEEFVILTVGRLDARKGGYKGHDRVIAELAKLEAPGRRLVYLVAGDGPDLERLQSLVSEHGVGGQVKFLGAVSGKDLPDLYRAADLFALPSTGEGFGIVFLEAMASGTPAIGLDIGGARDALANGKLGTCVAASSFPTALRDAIDRVAQSTDADRQVLSCQTITRFGVDKFAENLRSQMIRGKLI